MKTITVKQPWASLIVHGIKDIENRTWSTKFRGRVLIHASLKPVKGLPCEALSPLQYATVFNKKQLDLLVGPNSAIIGSVEIVDCVINHPSIWAEKAKEVKGIWTDDVVPYKNTRGKIKLAKVLSFEQVKKDIVWFNGIDIETQAKVWYSVSCSIKLMNDSVKPIYNWVLANPILFDKPIPAKGKLSFWEFPGILAVPEEENGKLFCHCSLPVKEENQIRGDSHFGFYCSYCGGRWYK